MADENINETLKAVQNPAELMDLGDMQIMPETPKPAPEKQQERLLNSDNMTLDQWVDALFAEEQKTLQNMDEKSKEDYRPTLNLGRFGLKTPGDVKKFLRSPAGEAVIGELGAQLALEEAIKEEQQFEQREHTLLMSRIKSMLFYSYLESKAHAASKVRDAIIAQNEKAIENAKTPPPQTQQSAASEKIKNIDNTLNNYSKAMKGVEEKEQMLDEKMAKLENESAHLEAKYDVYEANLLAFEQELDENPELSAEEITERLDALKAKMDAHTDEVHRLLGEGQEDDARVLLHALVGLNLQAANLHDMMAVHNKEKHMVDEAGNPTESIKAAKFVLNKDQKVVMHDGKPHLIKALDGNVKDAFEAMKKDPVAMAAAHEAFLSLKNDPHALSVKQVVQHNKVLENGSHNQELSETRTLQQDNQAQKLLINNEMSQLSAMKGEYLNQLSQVDNLATNKMTPSMEPTSTPTATKSSPKPSNMTAATEIYRKGLMDLKAKQDNKENVSREDLVNLVEKAPGKNKIRAKAYLQMEFVNMPRFGNIPFQTMQSMLKNLERFGVDSTKENVTSITNPFDKQFLNEQKPESEKQPEKTAEQSPTFSPSPFNMKPY